jgi:AraC-like DNA-binding protein
MTILTLLLLNLHGIIQVISTLLLLNYNNITFYEKRSLTLLSPSSYAFRTVEETPSPFISLASIGWDSTHSADYFFDVAKRSDPGHVIFQLTLSGEGRIRNGEMSHKLTAGNGFLIKVPSHYQYYYEPDSEQPWEFIWMNFKGQDAHLFCERLDSSQAPIIHLHSQAEPIQQFWKIYREISNEGLRDSQRISVMVYEWVLAMAAYGKDRSPSSNRLNPTIQLAEKFMSENFNKWVTLEDVADHAGVSKHYLCRLFQKHSEMAPMEYLRRRRIEIAASSLRNTAWPIQKLAHHCGFESVSYFGKIFRSYFNMSPSEYRNKELEFPYKNIYFD